MTITRQGNTLYITDKGFYEPPPLPRDYGRARLRSRVKRTFLVLCGMAIVTGALFGLSHT